MQMAKSNPHTFLYGRRYSSGEQNEGHSTIWVCDRVLVGSFISCYSIDSEMTKTYAGRAPSSNKENYCYKLV